MNLEKTLHWQILAAIILSVLLGIIFPTKYQLTEENYEKFAKEVKVFGVSEEKIANLQVLTEKQPNTETVFLQLSEQYYGSKLPTKVKKNLTQKAWHNPIINFFYIIGQLFIKALKMVIVPLILTSIISGISGIGSAGNLGRIGLKTLLYYLSTSTLAIIAGLFFVNMIKPGVGSNIEAPDQVEGLDSAREGFGDILFKIIPDNIFAAFAEQEMLAIIFFALLFGFFITKATVKNREFLTRFFDSSFEVMMKITMFIIAFTPIGIFGLIGKTVADHAGDPEKLSSLAQGLGYYSLAVIAALAFHAVVSLPMILKFVSKVSPLKHFAAMRSALMTAFSTSSSSATLSVTMNSVENNSGVSRKVSGFTLPLGATVNMDGTALYECVAAIFIAQAYGIDLSMSEQIIIVITALLASIGAAGIPMAGLVMISIILAAVNLPLEGIGLILAVDRVLDMFRTSVNVWSDSCGAIVIAKSEGEKLKV